MNAWMKLTWIDFKLFVRSLIVIFFTFAFPVMNVLVFGGMFGNEPTPFYGGRGSADVMVPGYIAALVIGSAVFMNLPLEMAARRQMGVLRRLRASPLHPLAVIGSQVTVGLLTTALSAVLLVVTGALAFGAMLPVNGLAVTGAFLLCCLSLYALTMLAANFFRNVNTARAVFMAVFFPMMFISGGTMPLALLPDAMQKLSRFLPLTYAVDLVKSAYLDGRFDLTATAVLGTILVVCTVLSVRFFRWE